MFDFVLKLGIQSCTGDDPALVRERSRAQPAGDRSGEGPAAGHRQGRTRSQCDSPSISTRVLPHCLLHFTHHALLLDFAGPFLAPGGAGLLPLLAKALPFDLFPSAFGTDEHLWEPGPATHSLVFPGAAAPPALPITAPPPSSPPAPAPVYQQPAPAPAPAYHQLAPVLQAPAPAPAPAPAAASGLPVSVYSATSAREVGSAGLEPVTTARLREVIAVVLGLSAAVASAAPLQVRAGSSRSTVTSLSPTL